MNQPGLHFVGDNYLTCNEIYMDKPIEAFGRYYTIKGVDFYTQHFYEEQYGRHFDLGRV